jgi:hypothetical protein
LKDIKTYAPKKITTIEELPSIKKKGIIDKLVPIIPENRNFLLIEHLNRNSILFKVN